ncbi:hypothetical protein ACGFZA_16035 [Streptomyces sp. NPDC048211]|uniref:hypothetical protein n=1 Tax=Streptomyces sp. NPDC048211 TaxID=3365516 RepID=UPI0037147404
MGSYNHYCNSDYRNEGWTFGGSGVSHCYQAWNNDDDTKYASCPSYKGRATVKFPVDISSGSIPDGAVITSVTINIRVKKTLASTKSVTVNMLSTEDTSRYTSRTLYPTMTIANYEVGTYTVDPVGKPWTRDRLNRLMVQVFSYLVPPNDGVRVYKVWATINYRVRPTVKVNQPTGTVGSPSPVVDWTYTHSDGDQQKSAEYKIFTAVQQGLSTFNPDTSSATYAGSVSGDITNFNLPTALTPDAYYIYVRARSVFDAQSAWAGRAFTVQGAAPGVPGGGFAGVGTGGGGGFESVIADPVTSNAYLTLRDGSNLLSVQQADFETTTDSLGYTATNCTIAQDTTTFFNVGGGSMKLTASSLGTMSAQSSFMEIAPSTPVTARAQFKAKTTSRTVNLDVLFYDESFTAISGTLNGTGTDLTGTWTEITCTGPTPAGAVYARVRLQVVTAASGSVHNVDNVGLMYGTNSVWSHGGHMSRNLLTSAASDGDDPVTAEAWAAASVASSYSRVAASGTGSEGSKQFKMTYVGLSPSLTYVATGTAFSDSTSGSGYTLNKPAGVADGDLLVAYVSSEKGGTPTPPAGWTLVDTVINDVGQVGLTVMMRDGLAADPSTWVGDFPVTALRKRAVVVAYRGAADTSTQLATENVATSSGGSYYPTSATIANTDPNAWRLSAFAYRDSASTGTSIANTQPPATVPPIAYVGKAPVWWYGGAQASYTLNRPTGVVSGDLMLAFGSFSGTATPTAPTGWTQVRRTVKTVGNGDDHSGTLTFVVWKRTAGSSEPASWSAAFSGSGTPALTQVVAYRNCETAANQFIDESGNSTSSSYQLTTPTVTNNDSKAWRVCAFGATTATGDSMTSTETIERCDDSTDVGAHPDPQVGVYDSNGPVSTGSYSRKGTVQNQDPWAVCSWIGIIKPLAVAPSAGANETERQDASIPSSGSNSLNLSVYDSNGVAPTGNQSVTGQYTPASGTTPLMGTASWIGFLTPAAPTVGGEVGATLVDYVDITSVDPAVIARSGGKLTYQAAFLGSTAGAPFLKVFFYVGNELVSTQVAAGQSFNTTTWVKSLATFNIPTGTTRVKVGVSATDRAVNDFVCWDRVSVAFGDSPVWRRGTGRPTHPIFNVPLLEYAEDLGDGYGEWKTLPGSERALLKYDQLTGLATYIDQTIIPLSSRKYRAKTVSYGLAGDLFASGYGPESDEVTLNAAEWWLKDPLNPDSSIQLKVKAIPLAVATSNTSAVFQPLGADRPIVLTEGYKGDTVSITVECDRVQYAKLRRLLNSGRTLFLQSNLDNAWWVRPVGDLGAETQLTGHMWTDPLRFVSLTFTEVASDL